VGSLGNPKARLYKIGGSPRHWPANTRNVQVRVIGKLTGVRDVVFQFQYSDVVDDFFIVKIPFVCRDALDRDVQRGGSVARVGIQVQVAQAHHVPENDSYAKTSTTRCPSNEPHTNRVFRLGLAAPTVHTRYTSSRLG